MSFLYFPASFPNVSGSGQYFSEVVLGVLCIYFSFFYVGGKNGLLARLKKDRRRARLIEQFPGPGCYPFLGSFPETYELSMKPCHDILAWNREMVEKFGPFCRLWFPGQPKIFISCAETAIKHLQNDSLRAKPSEVATIAKCIMGEGLLAHSPDVHVPRKKMWMQWMTRKNVDATGGIFQKQARELCRKLDKYQGTGKEFDAMEDVLSCAFKTIACSALGEDYMSTLPDSVVKQHVQDIHKMSYNITLRTFRPWLSNDWVFFNLSKIGKVARQCVDRANNITRSAVVETRLLRKNDQRKRENLPSFLDHLLDYEEKGILTEHDIINELNVFMVTGFDTGGLTACFTLYLLSLYPEHQDKVVKELLEIFDGEDLEEIDEITPMHIKKMKYLDLCIKESLRLYPILPWAFRRSTRDIELQDGRIIPEDVDVYVTLDIIHRDPKYFPEPEKFIPERHLVPIPAFMPFSLGSRGCVGQIYAYQELKMVLAHLLMKYRWETTEKHDLKPLFAPVLVPEHGFKFKIDKRFQILNDS